MSFASAFPGSALHEPRPAPIVLQQQERYERRKRQEHHADLVAENHQDRGGCGHPYGYDETERDFGGHPRAKSLHGVGTARVVFD